MSLTYGSACSGYGGLDLGVQSILGGETIWHVEFDKAPSKILEHHWPTVPNYGDFTKIDWHSVPRVHVMTAGYPCQPFSQAGKRLGADDPRHLWPHIAQAVAVLRPPLLVFENVRGHLTLGFDEVVRDLHQLGYDVTWYMLRAADVGAAHGRARLFIFGRNRGKCGVCGRTDRRGGVHRDPEVGRVLSRQAQGGNDGQGSAGAALGGFGAGREGVAGQGRDDIEQGDSRLDSDWGQSDGSHRATAPLSDGEGASGGHRAAVPDAALILGHGAAQGATLDSRSEGAGGDARVPHSGGEPEGARPCATDTPRGGAAGVLPPRVVVGAGGRPLGTCGVPGEVPDVRPDGGGSCLCDELMGGAHGRFRVFLFGTPANAGSIGWGEGASDGSRSGATSGAGQAGGARGHRVLGADGEGLTLLPTPAVNDMGAGKTVDDWDAWTARMKADHGNGNGHGKSLAIEAQRLLPTPVSDNSRGLPSESTDYASLANVACALLPTPGVAGGGKRIPDDAERSGNAAYKPDGTKVQVHLDWIAENRLLPTPRVTQAGYADDGRGGKSLDVEVRTKLLPTPRTQNNENRQSEGFGGEAGNFYGLIHGGQDWREYAAAIARAEHATGRTAPPPTEPGTKGNPRLSPAFVEWLMMLPAGHVTNPAIGLTRNEQLKALGNGVVPLQAAAATCAFVADIQASHMVRAS